jgi:hypothetical protein
MRRDLGQPDRGFGRFHLAEERSHTAELVIAPMLEKPRRLRSDLPLAGVGQAAPGIDVLTHLIDDGSRAYYWA